MPQTIKVNVSNVYIASGVYDGHKVMFYGLTHLVRGSKIEHHVRAVFRQDATAVHQVFIDGAWRNSGNAESVALDLIEEVKRSIGH